jgi:glycosyltransferase involved in cell wall biosynthesis
MGLMGLLVGKALKIPVIVHARGSDIHTFSEKNPLLFALTQFTVKNADCILAVSNGLKETIEKEFGISSDRIKVSMNGVDTSVFRPRNKVAQRRKLGLPLYQTIILFVGSLVPVKGLHYLIRAMPTLRKLHGDRLLFILAGGGELETELQQKTREAGIDRQVCFIGWVPNDQISGWMNAADVLILPSLHEGMPNTILEALACGVPVVASRVGGTTDLIQDGINGLLIEPASSESIVEKLDFLIKDRGLYERLRNNARMIGEEYRADWQTKALEKIYDSLRLKETPLN